MRWQAANQEILGRARSVTVPPWFRWAFLALVIGKFILVSHEEILPYLNDDSGFAQSAGVFYWKARWSEFSCAPLSSTRVAG